MTTLTFVEVLKREVGKMQAAHPEREAELSRAHALVLHDVVSPALTNRRRPTCCPLMARRTTP